MFINRQQAGELLAGQLKEYKGKKDVVVLGIPRGGVVVAKIVAQALLAQLDVVILKKVGAPSNPELAIGAVGPGGVVYWDNELCKRLRVTRAERLELRSKKLGELREREKLLRGKRKMITIKNKTVILVDDGVATGATVLAGAKFLKKMKVGKIILAVPVIAKDTLNHINRYFDEVVFLEIPEEFYAVGQFYQEFPQISDETVIKLLRAERLELRAER